MPSLLSRVIESHWQDIEIASMRHQVLSGIGDEGWAIHIDVGLQYRGQDCGSLCGRFEREDP